MSPRGRQRSAAAGTGAVNNKIYYSLGRPRKGAGSGGGAALVAGISRQVSLGGSRG